MRPFLITTTLLALITCGWGQTLEDWIEASDYPEELQEWLQELRESPVDLNQASVSEIAALPFLNRQVAREIVELRRELGGLRSLNELKSLHTLSLTQMNSLDEFTFIDKEYLSLKRASIRTSAAAATDTDTHFQSSTASYRLRGDFTSNRGSSGFLFGLRRAQQTDGFEEVSCGIELPEESFRLRILMGDYQIETGTGLVLATAYGMGSWLSSTEALSVPTASGLVSRPSSSRLAVQRGLSGEYNYDNFTGRVFGSINHLDAQVFSGETEKLTEGNSSSSDLQQAREDQLEERLIGANLEYSANFLELGATAYTAEFDPAFGDPDWTEPLPVFNNSSLQLASVHTRVSHDKVQAVSEFARSSHGGIAHQSALTYREETASWGVYHTHADEDFFSPHSRLWGGFGEDAGNAGETGIRTMFRGSGCQLTLGGSTSKTPFRTSTSPLSKTANEIRARLRVYPGAQFELNSFIHRGWTELTSNDAPSVTKRTDRGRVDLLIHGREEYKLRLDLKSSTRSTTNRYVLGTLAFFQMRTAVRGLNLFTRVALWNIEHSDASMSLYENSVYGAYPLVSLNGTGRRVALLLRKSWTPLRIGLKLGHTVSESINQSRETIDFALEISYRQ